MDIGNCEKVKMVFPKGYVFPKGKRAETGYFCQDCGADVKEIDSECPDCQGRHITQKPELELF